MIQHKDLDDPKTREVIVAIETGEANSFPYRSADAFMHTSIPQVRNDFVRSHAT